MIITLFGSWFNHIYCNAQVLEAFLEMHAEIQSMGHHSQLQNKTYNATHWTLSKSCKFESYVMRESHSDWWFAGGLWKRVRVSGNICTWTELDDPRYLDTCQKMPRCEQECDIKSALSPTNDPRPRTERTPTSLTRAHFHTDQSQETTKQIHQPAFHLARSF